MSVQKFRIKKGEGFTVISNRVIELLSDQLEALGLYTYLSSLPEDWEFHKSSLRTTCRVGINKLDSLIGSLVRLKLVEIIPVRNEKGQFVFFDMMVLNGFEPSETSSTMKTMPMETMPMENSTYKRNINKINKENNIFCSNELFDQFWNTYPRKQKKGEAKRVWIQKGLNNKADEIIADVRNRMAVDVQWQDKQFIPMATTWLRGERWSDEVIVHNSSQRAPVKPKPNEPKSTVKEWKPGNPDYDRVNTMKRESQGVRNDDRPERATGNNLGRRDLQDDQTNQVSRPTVERSDEPSGSRSDSPQKASAFILPRRLTG